MDKDAIATAFEEMAALLELKGENPFKIRAYLNAAHTLRGISEDIATLIREHKLTEYEGIGKALAEKIEILAATGTHPALEELQCSVPHGLLELLRIPGLGSKKIKVLYETLHIDSIPSLKKACINGNVAKLSGFGSKTENNILNAIGHFEAYSKRHLWWDVMHIAEPMLTALRAHKDVQQADIAGSARRKLETVGDLDFVAASDDPDSVMEWFTTLPEVKRILAHGTTKSSVRLKSGLQAELRIVPEKQYAFLLHHATGSKEHNVALRHRANALGLSLSEWGLTPDPFAKRKKSVTEDDIYTALGMEFIPPELRENMGEIDAALHNALPHLVTEHDLRGAFHVHTSASDGRATLEEMVSAAERLGWEYIGISDHSKSSFQANGLSIERLLEQVAVIHALNKSKKYKTHVFAGVECDILPNGSLDFPNEVLQELDFVIASVHSSMKQDEKTMTQRIIRAIENPYVTMLGHVTGRILLQREPYELDLQAIINTCIAAGTIMEINATPQRLDMDWRLWHAASQKGLIACINPDAHTPEGLRYVIGGINIARKGWLQKDQVLNTKSLRDIKKHLGSQGKVLI